jgi:outer membrane protein TolC
MLRSSLPSLFVALLASCASPPSGDGSVRPAPAWEPLRAAPEAQPRRSDPDPQDHGAELSADAGLADLLRFARANNRGIDAALRRWQHAHERVPQATALPEPRLTVSAMLEHVQTRVGPMEGSVGLMQAFPWFGELDLAGEIAYQEAEVAREMLAAEILELDERVREAWYEMAWLEQAILVTAANRELLVHWESVARARMETGLGSHADVVRAQVELGKVENQHLTLLDMRRPLAARLNAALGRPADAPLPAASLPAEAPPELDAERLAAALAQTSPTLRAQGYRAVAARRGIDLADKAFYPDLALGVEYTAIGSAVMPGVDGSGDDAIALTLGVDLPVWRSAYRAGARGAEARARAARMEELDAHDRLSAELQMVLYRFRDADRRVGLYRDGLVPKGSEAVQALDIAYQAGDEGFLDLIDAQRVLLEFQLQAARAETDRAQALAETERITGVQMITE